MKKLLYGVLLVIIVLSLAASSKNSSPQVTSLTAQPSTVARGEVSTLTCDASDPDGNTLTYSWTCSGGSISGNGRTASWTAPSTLGIYTVTVTVNDGKGATATLTTSISVANRNPDITALTASPAVVNGGGTSTIKCTASDPDNDTLTFDLWSCTGGSISGTGSTVTWTAPATFGIYTITTTVNDGNGGTDTASVAVTVTNHNPNITSLTATPTAVYTGGSSTIKCTASDADSDTLTYSWTYTGGSISGTGSSVIWTAPAMPGTYTISALVSDGKGGTDTHSISIAVTNRNPDITALTATPTSVASGASSTIQCTASDADGDTIIYAWLCSGGSIVGSSSAVTWTAPSAFGIYTITAIVSDGKGGSDTYSISVPVTNRNPVISVLTASPTSVHTAATSTISCTATDADGDTLAYSWTYTGGSISGTGSSVTWTAPSTAGTYTITVVVSDGKGGTATRSVSVTVTSS